jgi:phospholipid transport system substrate-binding protein
MNRVRLIVVLAGLLAMTTAAFGAEAAGPMDYLGSMDKKLKPLLGDTKKNEKKILKIVNNMMDFPTLCQKSLGRHWKDRTEAERKEFTDTLHALIEKNVVKRLKDTKGHIVTYESEEIDGGSATVVTIVSSGDGPRATQTEIVYKMKKKGARWAVVDMITDGVSLVQNYRSQFNKIITKDGWDVLMQKMKDKLAEADK